MAEFASLESTETLDQRLIGEDASAGGDFFTGFDDAAKASALIPNDTLFGSQWHLFNTGQGGGVASVDIRIVAAWDYRSGAGITFGVYDDGVDRTHPDLASRYDSSRHITAGGQFFDPTVFNTGDAHGTAVAGLIAASGGNGLGTTGGSFNGRITGVDIFAGTSTYSALAMSEQDRFSITNHSWGWISPFADNLLRSDWTLFFSGMRDAAVSGRGGLGTIQMVAAGNDRDGGTYGATVVPPDNTNTSNFTSSRYVNAIAAVTNRGEVAFYSNPGASLLISAPSNGGTLGVTTTDYTGAGRGYDAGDYTSGFGGTSAATPIASGAVGLILEANPGLGYRDMQEILAMTARQIGTPLGSGEVNNIRPWVANGGKAWNGGGMHFSHDYGFGLLDTFAAMKLATNWTRFEAAQTAGNEQSRSVTNFSAGLVNNSNAFERIFNLTPVSGQPLTIEAVEVQINWTTAHTYSGDLVIELISPSGTVSYLLDRNGRAIDLDRFVFTTRAHLGEQATGQWRVRITDADSRDSGFVSNITVTAYGNASANTRHVFTDEFSIFGTQAARRTISDTDGGVDELNFTPLSTGVNVSLESGATSTVAGQTFTIAGGTVIERVEGSWSSDVIHGNGVANHLSANAGDDLVTGQGGDDTIIGFDGNDTLEGGTGDDILDAGPGRDVLRGGTGNDWLDGGFGFDTARYALNARDVGWRRQADGSVQVGTGGEGVDRLFRVEALLLLDRTISLTPSLGRDFNGDGRGDLLTRRAGDGAITSFTFGSGMTGVNVSLPTPGATLLGTADVSGDGAAELIWRLPNSAGLQFRPLSGAGAPSVFDPGTAWTVRAVGDFDGDTRADLLWGNAAGQTYIWLMDGTSGASRYRELPSPGAGWVVQGSGDLNGDGRGDIVWRHSNGLFWTWLMDGTTIIGDGGQPSPGANWTIKGIGDLDGDGRGDIVWRNDAGLIWSWFMDGAIAGRNAAIGNPGANWDIVAVADASGDGLADIIHRNTTGQSWYWVMQGSGIADSGFVAQQATEWNFIA